MTLGELSMSFKFFYSCRLRRALNRLETILVSVVSRTMFYDLELPLKVVPPTASLCEILRYINTTKSVTGILSLSLRYVIRS